MKHAILDLAKKLIAVASTKDKPEELKRVIEVAIKDLSGFTVERFEKKGIPSVLVYKGNERPNRFKIILNAHLDVVAGREEQYKPVEKNGKLYGRGSSDMKAAAAVEILVFKELANLLPYKLGLQLVTDEEIGGFNAAKHQIEQGIRADFVIAGEPTDFGVNNQAKGIIWAKIKTTGRAAHGAYLWQGNNAIVSLVEAAHRILQTHPVPTKEVWETTYNLSWIKTSNETVNKVPDEAQLQLDIRYIPSERETVIENLKKILPKGVELEVQLTEPAQFTDEKNKYVLALSRASSKITGKKTPVIVKHGGSDIRHFNAVGVNGVTFGPIGAGLHTDAEWVDIESLSDYYAILKEFLLTL